MSEAVTARVSVLEDVAVRVARGRRLRLAGILKAQETLEEVLFLAPANLGSALDGRRIRAFRVHGTWLESGGLRDGDHVIVEVSDETRPGSVVLIEEGGRPMLRRVVQRVDGSSGLARCRDGLPLFPRHRNPQIIGRFAGIVRRRGRFLPSRGESASGSAVAGGSNHQPKDTLHRRGQPVASKASARINLLLSKLDGLESTFAETTNPVLRRALQNEAGRIRCLLQNEAG